MKNCVFCGRRIQRKISIQFIFSLQGVEDAHVCQKCFQQFEPLAGQSTCPGCNRMRMDKTMCEDCLKWSTAYKNIVPNHQAIFSYNEIARELMARFKFQGDVVLGRLFKDVLASELNKMSKTHRIVPIPMSQQAKETRGFNQVEVLLREANIPFEDLLIHTGLGKKQSSKTKDERLHTSQPFKLKESKVELNAKPILIVDDVYTTGRTIYHARNLLETIGRTKSFSLFR